MKANKFLTTILPIAACVLQCRAGTLVTSSLDSGGGRTTSGNYVIEASIGSFGGIADGGSSTNRAGYLGQLTEVASVSITGVPSQVNETATTQLSGAATMDDETVTSLTGSEIKWGTAAWPVSSIDSKGLATTTIVYQDTPAALNGSYLGVSGSGTLLVLDSIPDNYGSYAGDGLPDWWQNQYFNLNNTNAAPNADPTGCGQNNQFKYIAGLDPTNAASVFHLRVESVSGQPTQKKLVFSPRWNDRTYAPMFRTNLVSGAGWTNLLTFSTSDSGTERTVTDTNATQNTKFYTIKISYP